MSVAEQQSLPARLGRYEILARLATGGMAEILLARVRGPSGFERAVVIKRILPHCASLPPFVDMFLDEARIAARIHHPNVVQVQELGEDGDDLFLVMEYLQGESTASIMRRMAARARLPTPTFCAHVVAEACAGLHAAHELTGPDGRSVGLVHRDVSPQNVFVTYDGAVKVLDFGIAKAADRISHTEAGTLKGKFDYMSPEQADGLSLDRRSDLFSAGIVLYEMSTGRRLFKRGRQVESLRAVREAPIVPPSRMVADYPPELEAVCMRALERDPDQRYQTAAEMRRDLGRVLRALSPQAHPEEEVATTVRELFAERMDQKHRMMEQVRAGTDLHSVPTAEVDVTVDIPEVDDTVLAGEHATTPYVPASSSRGRPGGRRWLWLAAALVPLAGAGAWVAAQGGEPPGEGRAEAGPASEEPAAVPVPPTETPVPDVATELEAPVAAPAPAEVLLRVESEPPGARLMLDGEPHGETPTEVRVARGSAPLHLRLEREGYDSLEREIVPEMSQLLQLTLDRDRRPRRRRPRPSGGEDEPAPRPSDYFRRFE